MRGRMYDPLAGRFASADPIIQAPFFSQGLNRYAYVFNDPVNLTDPSGFQVWVGDVFYTADVPAAFAGGGYAGGGMGAAGAIGGAGGDPAALMGGAGAGSWAGIIAGGTGLAINATTWSSLPWERTPGHSRTTSLGNRAGQSSQATASPSNAKAQNDGRVGAPGQELGPIPETSPTPHSENLAGGWFKVGKAAWDAFKAWRHARAVKAAADAAKAARAAPLSKEALKSIRSLEQQIAKHQQKLAEFKANPTVRPGMENLPKEVIQKQQQVRIQHLEKEIQTFRDNIGKIRRGEL